EPPGAVPLPQTPTETRYRLSGLAAPARIVVDRWGVPHISAESIDDAFFVQGFNAARDRLWQIDTWRRRGLGLLAEAFGPAWVEQDRAARLFLYRGDLYREWLAYSADAKAIATSFTAGINAYIDLTAAKPDLLPPEFTLLDYAPARWAPEDIVRIRSHGLWRNVTAEVQRARIACRHGLPAAQAWKVLEPDWTARLPAGLDPCTIPEDVLDVYLLAKAPVRFDATPLVTAAGARQHDRAGWQPSPVPAAGTPLRRTRLAEIARADLDRNIGSNNWVVAPSRTATGRPILANDPHRAHDVPSLRYIAHLSAPGLDVIGAGEPALPGISIGHNGTVAFGLTIFGLDHEDLYVYQRDRNGYRYQSRSEPIVTVAETIPVRGEPPRTVQLRFTRHGPIVFEDAYRLFALRAAWLEPGMAPYFGSVEYMRARDWRSFLHALNRWGAPAENQVYADTRGNIGYKPAGLFPKRTDWDGLLPVPGDGRYEWQGFFDMDALPVEYNPARGFTGSANNMNLPPDFPIAERRIGFEWSAPWRYRRLWEVLEASNPHTPDDSLRLQRDYLALNARAALAPLSDVMPSDVPATAAPLALLRAWDQVMTAESAAALLFAQWFYRDLPLAVAEQVAPGAARDLQPMDGLTLIAALDRPDGQQAALAALARSFATLQQAYGENPDNWRWGDVHRIRFQHPLLGRASPELAAQMRLPDFPRGGAADTVNNTG
ncbi:MAG: penicillin acylase family protein, partial [Gammaproteobacteria bacterium]